MSIYYYDKNQNKKWEIFDSSKLNRRKEYYIEDYEDYPHVIIDDILRRNDEFLIVYNVHNARLDAREYFVENIKFGEKIHLASLDNKERFAIDYTDYLKIRNYNILEVRLLNENTLIYEKQFSNNSFGLYLYNIATGNEEKIDEFDSRIEFDLKRVHQQRKS